MDKGNEKFWSSFIVSRSIVHIICLITFGAWAQDSDTQGGSQVYCDPGPAVAYSAEETY